jgi:hypothetical protein
MFHNISLRLKIQNTTDEELYDTTFLLSIRVNPWSIELVYIGVSV